MFSSPCGGGVVVLAQIMAFETSQVPFCVLLWRGGLDSSRDVGTISLQGFGSETSGTLILGFMLPENLAPGVSGVVLVRPTPRGWGFGARFSRGPRALPFGRFLQTKLCFGSAC